MAETGQVPDTDTDTNTELWIVRHGETEWSRDRKHTSRTDLDLTQRGEEVARTLHERLAGGAFDLVLTSPMLRARRTAQLAGFDDAESTEDLREWGYGDYEGRTSLEIREEVPGWTVWSHGSPHGETAQDLTTRLDRLLERVRGHGGRVLVFSHGHTSRALAARWLGLEVTDGRMFTLDTATISVLGHERESPSVVRWNC